ncbi:MAG: type IV pilus biogenesis protein PilM [Pirellulales bacterium]
MARLLALEWDDREARLAVASTRGERIILEQAFSVALGAQNAEPAKGEPDIGEAISAALAARRLSRLETLVAVGRPSIELKNLSLPPAPDAELPDMVRFQAMREFNTLGEDWPLDFLPITGSAEEPRNVLAATIAPELVEQIQSTCQTAGLKPVRLVLRPCPAASLLLKRLGGGEEQVRLLIDVLAEEADLTVIVGSKVVFLRTTRLPGDVFASPEQSGILVAEVRRTIAAVQNQLGGRPVEAIYLCGSGRDHTELAERLTQELTLPSHVFDPFAGLDLEGELLAGLPENPGQFAPLLGMLLDEADGTPHAFDFLHPRRRPEPPSRGKRAALVGGIAVAVALVAGLGLWLAERSLASEIDQLTQEKLAQKAPLDRAAKVEQVVKKIDEWASTDVVWIDELRELSQDVPSAKDVIATKLTFSPTVSGGQMDLDGSVREASAVDSLETALRDSRHRVEGKGTRQNKDGKGYAWQFGTVITVIPESKAAATSPKGAASKPAGSPEKPAASPAKGSPPDKGAPVATPDKGAPPDKAAPATTPAAPTAGPEKPAPPPDKAAPPPTPEKSPPASGSGLGPRGESSGPAPEDPRRNRDSSRRRRDR